MLGGIGLILGFYLPNFSLLSAGGLTLLMVLGMIARIRIKDPVIAILPASSLFCENLFLFISAF
jgi:hypothetical protein